MRRSINVGIKRKKPYIPKIELSELPFFVSYAIFILFETFEMSFFAQYIDSLWKPVFIICVGLLAIHEIVKNGLNKKSFFIVGAMLLLFVNITRIGQGGSQNSIALLMFFMFCVRDINLKKLAWFTMIISGAALSIIVLCSYAGIIPNYVEIGSRRREYLGFRYALYGSSIIANLSLLWIYFKRERITIKGVVILALINLFFYKKTDSRLCFFLTVIMLFFGLFLRNHSRFVLNRKWLCRGMVVSFILAACISFYISIHYQPNASWMASLDKALGGRLSLGQASLKQYGVSLLGIKGIKWVGNGLDMYGEKIIDEYLYVDSYFIQVAQRFGYLFLILVIILLTYACYRAYKNRDIYLLSILCLLAVHFMIDDLIMYAQYNTFWLIAGKLVFRKPEISTNYNCRNIISMITKTRGLTVHGKNQTVL